MRRAVLMFDGPKRFSKHCEGCCLFESASDEREGGPTCPIWGTLYRETKGHNAGLLCRADECIDNEIAISDQSKRDSIWTALEAGR
jgi:hypothetical protein